MFENIEPINGNFTKSMNRFLPLIFPPFLSIVQKIRIFLIARASNCFVNNLSGKSGNFFTQKELIF